MAFGGPEKDARPETDIVADCVEDQDDSVVDWRPLAI
jgi:hypothetical protein